MAGTTGASPSQPGPALEASGQGHQIRLGELLADPRRLGRRSEGRVTLVLSELAHRLRDPQVARDHARPSLALEQALHPREPAARLSELAEACQPVSEPEPDPRCQLRIVVQHHLVEPLEDGEELPVPPGEPRRP